MKKIFTLAVIIMTTLSVMAQMHGAMKFAGASRLSVSTTDIDNEDDVLLFTMTSPSTGDITLPEMKGMAAIPSFTIKDVTFSLGADHVVNFPEQTFALTVMADGVEKAVTGSSLSGSFNMADNSLTLTAVFKYGTMPFAMTYNIKAYYVKPVTNSINVSIGGIYNYNNENVTYNVRKYMDDGVEKVDVEVPSYTLDNTMMGNLTLGGYTVKGLLYDEAKQGYYRDYKDDNLSFHFTAENGGTKTMDGDYVFNSSKDNNILVKYSGTEISSIVNTFQMGSMPFSITTTFGNETSGIDDIIGTGTNTGQRNNAVYDLQGRRVGADAKGIVIINGKKYLRK